MSSTSRKRYFQTRQSRRSGRRKSLVRPSLSSSKSTLTDSTASQAGSTSLTSGTSSSIKRSKPFTQIAWLGLMSKLSPTSLARVKVTHLRQVSSRWGREVALYLRLSAVVLCQWLAKKSCTSLSLCGLKSHRNSSISSSWLILRRRWIWFVAGWSRLNKKSFRKCAHSSKRIDKQPWIT